MSDKKPADKKPLPPLSRARRRPERALLAAFILMLGIAAYQFNTEGYGVLIGSAQESSEGSSKMVRLSCTYFTGTEKFISHVMRVASDARAGAKCGFFTKLPKVKEENPYEITIPGGKTIPFGPQKGEAPPAPPSGALPKDTPPTDAPPAEPPKP